MPRFRYECVMGTTGTLTADSLREARDVLRSQGTTPLTLSLDHFTDARLSFWARRQLKQRMPLALRELATLLRVGIPLVNAIAVLEKQTEPRVAMVLQSMREQISNGATLADAMQAHPLAFDTLAIHMVAVGEQSGHLVDVLQKLSEYHKQSKQLKGKILGALSYPLLVLSMGIVITLFLMSWVVPELIHTLESLGKPLPTVTRVIKHASDMVVYQWWVMLLVFGGFAVAAFVLFKRPAVKRVVEKWVLGTPVIGPLVRQQTTAEIAFVMATLLDTHIPADQAFALTANGHAGCFGEALNLALQATKEGKSPEVSLVANGAFDTTAIRVFAIGMQSGELAHLLHILAEESRERAQVLSGRLVGLLEPIFICFVAGLVLTIALATLLPVLEIGHAL